MKKPTKRTPAGQISAMRAKLAAVDPLSSAKEKVAKVLKVTTTQVDMILTCDVDNKKYPMNQLGKALGDEAVNGDAQLIFAPAPRGESLYSLSTEAARVFGLTPAESKALAAVELAAFAKGRDA